MLMRAKRTCETKQRVGLTLATLNVSREPSEQARPKGTRKRPLQGDLAMLAMQLVE